MMAITRTDILRGQDVFCPVLRIHEILVRILTRIRILLFSSLIFKTSTKIIFVFLSLFAYYFLKVPTFTKFFKVKKT
jgi:hypothetical protein